MGMSIDDFRRTVAADPGRSSPSILTTTPNAVASEVLDRVPVILCKDDYDLWLDPAMTNVGSVSDLLKPFDARMLRMFPVSSRVNQVENDDEELFASCRHHQG